MRKILLPVANVCRVLVGAMHRLLAHGRTPQGWEGDNQRSLLDLAFLYGTLPTAPSTIVIAQAHGASTQTVVSAAVLNMALSAPLAFTSTVLMSTSRLALTLTLKP